ncbi:MAG: snare associated Golgi protein family [Monoraphidium minutum]|nr:MAG: snare associated Golgi protein family [Monoraphidium minutum]
MISGGATQQTIDFDDAQTKARLWREARRSVAVGLVILAFCAVGLSMFVMSMPKLQPHEFEAVVSNFPPRSLEAVITLRNTLLNYADTYPKSCAAAILMTYVIMQTFAIPGTVSLSLLCGALYGTARGVALVCVISTLGATACYCMSCLFGRPVALAIWRDRLQHFAGEVSGRSNDLLSYIIFLRVTPILPNTFINVASPVVGVPLAPFFFGTLIGCLPNNFMAAHAGDHLSDLHSLADLYSPRIIGLGLVVGCVALLPVWWKHGRERGEAAATSAAAKRAKAA